MYILYSTLSQNNTNNIVTGLDNVVHKSWIVKVFRSWGVSITEKTYMETHKCTHACTSVCTHTLSTWLLKDSSIQHFAMDFISYFYTVKIMVLLKKCTGHNLK